VNDLLRNPQRTFCAVLLASILIPVGIFGQATRPSLSGQVLDPSGAAVPALTVSVTGPGGTALLAQTDDQGRYAFRNLPPGTYTVKIQLKGFTDFVKTGIVIARGQPQVVDAHLEVALEKQQVTVTDETTKVSVTPSENASSLVIKGKDIEALSDDPDELESELEALAGPAAGPNGGQIYIDGFTGGQLPPKSAIREIRVNQNPFSAQYDSLGYGRIEVLTKPGMDKLHGQVFMSGNDSAFNTRNPFAAVVPAYHSEYFDGNLGGPLNKKTSFYVDGERRNIETDSIVSAVILDSNFNQVPFSQALPAPQTRTNIAPRIDTQFGSNNTLTVRYSFWQDHETNQGVGQFSLPSLAYNTGDTWNSVQVSDAQVINEKAVTEVRFRYYHDHSTQTPQSTLPTISVLGAFFGGGSSSGTSHYTEDNYEFQDYTSWSLNKNFVKFGVRLRDSVPTSSSTSNFNGTFTFPSILAYQITEKGLAAGETPAQISAAGGGASQFLIVAGTPVAHINYYDLEPYVEDDWKARPNLTLSAGLRYETQNHIHDHADFAPRLGLAWGLGKGKTPKTVLRAGSGIFYDRFSDSPILNAQHLNGINEQQYIVTSPDFFPTIPSVSMLTATPTVYQIAPNLRAPYTIQSGVGLERQVSKISTVSVTYLNNHGDHRFHSRNINAPDPADPSTSPYPFGGTAPLYQYESDGLYNQNQLITNFNVRTSKVSLFGYYTLSFADSDFSGVSSFPMNQYNLEEDYGRAPWDVRDRVFLGGSWNLPHGFQIFPFMVANSETPFNITVGQDYNGSSIFNNRPTFATDTSAPGVVVTHWGAFNTNAPTPGETPIPVNYGTGFGQFVVNLRVSKTWGFGREISGAGSQSGNRGGGGHQRGLGGQGLSGGGGMGGLWSSGVTTNRRYNLTLSVSARNLFNNVNLAAPIGNLNSPLFGQANALAGGFYNSSAANRRIDLQLRFTF
jgi:hypothetical protein